MAHKVGNLLKQVSTSTGATLTLAGTPARPYRPFSAILANGDTVDVIVKNRSADEWQAGRYSYAGGVLTLVRRFAGSTGSAISFTAGTKDVESAALAEDGRFFLEADDYTARDGDRISADTSNESWTFTLPASLGAGAEIAVQDPTGAWLINPLAVVTTGDDTLDGAEDGMTCSTPARLVFVDAADGWVTREYVPLFPFLTP